MAPFALMNSMILLALMALPASGAPGHVIWTRAYNAKPSGSDVGESVVVTPSGSEVVVTGLSTTVAYDPASGATDWKVPAPTDSRNFAAASASSAFIARSTFGASSEDFVIDALDPATGSAQWASLYDTPDATDDYVGALTVSADGSTVFVSGESQYQNATDGDITTVAFDADTGVRLWARRYDGPGTGYDYERPFAMDASSDAGLVVVTGESVSLAGSAVFVTIAYSGATGKRLWTKRIDLSRGSGVAIAPDAASVYLTGQTRFPTIALDAATGARLWISRFEGATSDADRGSDIEVSPDGSTVFATGVVDDSEVGTVAYDAVTGAQLWAKTYQGPNGYAEPLDLALSSDGSRLVIGGFEATLVNGSISDFTFDFLTIAYGAAAGTKLWRRSYDGPDGLGDVAASVALAPDGSAAFVTGSSRSATTSDDYRTFSYKL
jgi:hypothetical protein